MNVRTAPTELVHSAVQLRFASSMRAPPLASVSRAYRDTSKLHQALCIVSIGKSDRLCILVPRRETVMIDGLPVLHALALRRAFLACS